MGGMLQESDSAAHLRESPTEYRQADFRAHTVRTMEKGRVEVFTATRTLAFSEEISCSPSRLAGSGSQHRSERLDLGARST